MAGKEELEQYLNSMRKSDSNQECPVKCTLEIIGGKWKLRILAQLLKKEVVRFNQLKREISGITNTMLSNSLHELEQDCNICIKACPQEALDGITINQKKCREKCATATPRGGFIYACNICRKVCPFAKI